MTTFDIIFPNIPENILYVTIFYIIFLKNELETY